MSRDELGRLLYGPEPGQKLGGIGSVRFFVRCENNAEEVLAKAKEVLQVVLSQDLKQWPSNEEWRKILPPWFVTRCGRELSPEETEQLVRYRRSLSPENRVRAVEDYAWPLSNWIHWFQPENRFWYWWDAEVLTPGRIWLAVEVTEWPFPWDALKWLFRASGATTVVAED